LQGDDLVAQIGHFSDFLVGIRKLGDKLAEKLIPITDWIVFQSGLVLKRTTPPVCANGTNTFPKWLTVTDTDQDENSRVRWCTEVREDKLVLRVRGNRPYAQLLALRDLTGGPPFSSDPFTMPISTAMLVSDGGRFFWVRSDTQLDIVFSQPTSGPAVQTIKVDPIPDLAGTIGVKLAQEAMKESPDALSQILGNWDCITRIARARLPMPDAEAIANAFALAEECLGHLLPPKAKTLLGAKNAVTQVPDYATDMANGQSQIDFVVGRSTDSTTTTSTTSSTTTTSTTAPARGDTGPDHFFSPSENIACFLRETGARCDIAMREWVPPPKPSNCTLDWGYAVSVAGNSPGQFRCASDTAGHAPAVLAYGSVARRGPFECRSREAGMECVNLDTGHGFEVSRGEYRLF
jgi:hypothetical protein